jgi:hypothetical protein
MSNLTIVVIDSGDHMTTFTSPKFVRTLRQLIDEHGQK